MTAAHCLALAGGTLTILGTCSVIYGIRRSIDALKRYETRPQYVFLQAISQARSYMPSASLDGGRVPTIEERLQVLERTVANLPDQVDEKIRTERDRVETSIGAAQDAAIGEATRQNTELADVIKAVAVRSWRSIEVGGVALIILGTALSTASSFC